MLTRNELDHFGMSLKTTQTHTRAHSHTHQPGISDIFGFSECSTHTAPRAQYYTCENWLRQSEKWCHSSATNCCVCVLCFVSIKIWVAWPLRNERLENICQKSCVILFHFPSYSFNVSHSPHYCFYHVSILSNCNFVFSHTTIPCSFFCARVCVCVCLDFVGVL